MWAPPTRGSADVRVFAICQDELVIRSFDEVLLPSFEVEFLVESKPLARRLHDAEIEDTGHRSIRKTLAAVRGAGGTLVYVLHTGAHAAGKAADVLRAEFPDVTHMDLSEL